MSWFFIALINPLAHATVNHLDKYIISKYFKGDSVGALIIFSALFAVVALPVLWIIDSTVFKVTDYKIAILLMVNGALLVTAIIFYLYALKDNEASFVAPFFQLVPVFAFFLGYFFLGEVLTQNQVFATILLITGALIFSLDFTGKSGRINWKLLFYMFCSSLLYAANAVIFKTIAIDQGFTHSLFWDMTGKFIFGVILFVFVASYREQFISIIKNNGFYPVFLNSLNEIIALIGEIALIYAVLLAPVALVQAVGGLQPAFVFVLGLLITLLFPKFGEESLKIKILSQKIIGIAVIVFGFYFIS